MDRSKGLFIDDIVNTVQLHLLFGAYLAIMISPVLSTDVDHATITRLQGQNVSIIFNINVDLESASIPYYTLQREKGAPPFCIDGKIRRKYLPNGNQHDRFSVRSETLGQVFYVRLSINYVSIDDEGLYIMQVIVYGDKIATFSRKQFLTVDIPPSVAECHLKKSSYMQDWLDVHCEANPGTCLNSTISCFQDGGRLPYNGKITNDGVQIRGVFWYNPNSPIRCCSHMYHDVEVKSCSDFVWPTHQEQSTDRPFPTLAFPLSTLEVSERLIEENNHPTLRSAESGTGKLISNWLYMFLVTAIHVFY